MQEGEGSCHLLNRNLGIYLKNSKSRIQAEREKASCVGRLEQSNFFKKSDLSFLLLEDDGSGELLPYVPFDLKADWEMAPCSNFFSSRGLCSACPPALNKEHESSSIVWSRGEGSLTKKALISGLDGTDLGVIFVIFVPTSTSRLL